MRVAHVVSSYHPHVGGVEMHVRRIAEGCGAAGDAVTVLTHRRGLEPIEDSLCGVTILRFPLVLNSANYAFAPGLFRYLRRNGGDFDVIHAHSYHTIVGQAALRAGPPLVFTPHYHGTGHTAFRALLHRVYRPVGGRQFSAAAAVICVSDAERELVARDFPQAAARVSVIPNGVDRRPPQRGSSAGLPEFPFVLTAGRLERYKNIELLIRAFLAVDRAAVLVIVGDGPDRPRLEQLAAGAGGRIRFTGRIPDEELASLLAHATVVTSASAHEAFGLVVAEGLIAGARVVAADIPAFREVGQLAGPDAPISFVDPGNVPQYAHALTETLDRGRDQGARVTLASWAEVVARTRQLYANVARAEPISALGRQGGQH